MKIDEKELTLLEELAGLRVPDDERGKIIDDLGSILRYVEMLQSLDLEQKDYDRDVIAGDDFRDDVVGVVDSDELKLVLDNMALKSDDGLLEAHAVLDHKK